MQNVVFFHFRPKTMIRCEFLNYNKQLSVHPKHGNCVLVLVALEEKTKVKFRNTNLLLINNVVSGQGVLG